MLFRQRQEIKLAISSWKPYYVEKVAGIAN
jgi:hypothetical protein